MCFWHLPAASFNIGITRVFLCENLYLLIALNKIQYARVSMAMIISQTNSGEWNRLFRWKILSCRVEYFFRKKSLGYFVTIRSYLTVEFIYANKTFLCKRSDRIRFKRDKFREELEIDWKWYCDGREPTFNLLDAIMGRQFRLVRHDIGENRDAGIYRQRHRGRVKRYAWHPSA